MNAAMPINANPAGAKSGAAPVLASDPEPALLLAPAPVAPKADVTGAVSDRTAAIAEADMRPQAFDAGSAPDGDPTLTICS